MATIQQIKKRLELKIQDNNQNEAMEKILLKRLKEEYGCKDVKEGHKKLTAMMNDRETLEEEYQKRLDKLNENIQEHGLLKD